MNKLLRSSIVHSTALVALLGALASCRPAQDDREAGTGRVMLALSATGPDGASYRLPPDSELVLTSQADPALQHAISLGGEEPTRTALLPVGTYLARTLTPGGRDIDTLLRGDTLVPVPARLQALPPVTVVEGETTIVVLHFVVQQAGDIAFQTGSARVSVEVETESIAPARLTLAGSFVVASQDLQGDQDLVELVTTAPGTAMAYALSISWPRTWSFVDDELCGGVDSVGTPPEVAPAGLARIFDQATRGSRGQLCFLKAPDRRMALFLQKAPGDDELFTSFADHRARAFPVRSFSLVAVYTLPEPAWDGQTLRLSALHGGEATLDSGHLYGRSGSPTQRLLTQLAAGGSHRLRAEGAAAAPPEGTGTGTPSACETGCPANTFDLDGSQLTGLCGCEYACTKQSDVDPIDPGFIDANCDGGDGVVEACVYVSASVGAASGGGTRSDPVDTIATGIARALASGVPAVCVSGESYQEAVSVPSGVSLYGGFDQLDPAFAFRRAAHAVTRVTATGVVFHALQIDRDTQIAGFTIIAETPAAPGASAFGVRLDAGVGLLTVSHNVIEAGAGAPGGGSFGIFAAGGQLAVSDNDVTITGPGAKVSME